MTREISPEEQKDFADGMAWRTRPQGEAFEQLMQPHRPRGIHALGYRASAGVIETTNGDALPLPEEALPITFKHDSPTPDVSA